jgi:hypothetical protein
MNYGENSKFVDSSTYGCLQRLAHLETLVRRERPAEVVQV